MQVRLLVSAAVASFFFVQSAFAAYIVSPSAPDRRVRVTETTDYRLVFEDCQGAEGAESCRVIGDSAGYTADQVSAKLKDFDRQQAWNAKVNWGIIAATMLAGAAYGVRQANIKPDLTILRRIWRTGTFSTLFTMAGGAAGTAIVVVKRNTYDNRPVEAANALALGYSLASVDTVFVTEDSIEDLIRAINFALMAE